jgi:hypothetical protein
MLPAPSESVLALPIGVIIPQSEERCNEAVFLKRSGFARLGYVRTALTLPFHFKEKEA